VIIALTAATLNIAGAVPFAGSQRKRVLRLSRGKSLHTPQKCGEAGFVRIVLYAVRFAVWHQFCNAQNIGDGSFMRQVAARRGGAVAWARPS
jgi:hypothetical protein